MSAPKPWRDGEDAAPPEALDLLRRAAPSRRMTEADRSRTSARLASVGLAVAPALTASAWGTQPAAGAAALTPASAKAATSLVATGAKGIVLLAGALLLATTGRSAPDATRGETPQPPLAAVESPASSAPAAGSTVEITAAVPAPAEVRPAPSSKPRAATGPMTTVGPEPPPRREPVAVREASRPPAQPAAAGVADLSPEDSLVREAAMLERARSALARDPSSALTLLEEHRAKFPRGQLGSEREFMVVEALLHLGRKDEAQRRAQALIARSPASPYAERLKRLMTPREPSRQ